MEAPTKPAPAAARDGDAPPWERVRQAEQAADEGRWQDALALLHEMPPLSAPARELSRRFMARKPDLRLPAVPEGLDEDPRRTVRAAWRIATSSRVLPVLAIQLAFTAVLLVLILTGLSFVPGSTILHAGFVAMLMVVYLKWAVPLGIYNRNLAWSDPRKDPGFSMDRLPEVTFVEALFTTLAMGLVTLPILLSLHEDTGSWTAWVQTLTLAPLTRPLASASAWPLLLAPLTAFVALRLLQGPLTGGPDARWAPGDRLRLLAAQARAALCSCAAHVLVLILGLIGLGGSIGNLLAFLFAWSFLAHVAGLLGRQTELQG